MMRDEVRPAPKGSSVPRRVRRVLLRGLAKDPGARWPSMDALLAALEQAARGRRSPWVLGAGAVLAGLGLASALLPRTDPVATAAADVPDTPPPAALEGLEPSPEALALRERGQAMYAADDLLELREAIERVAPAEALPDDPTLAAEVMLWRGRALEGSEQGAAMLRKAYFLAHETDVPSVEARAAGALTRSMFAAHTEGVAEWLRLAWLAVERVPWDRSAAIEVATTAAHSTALTWQITGDEQYARAVLEFADATVGAVELDDDAFVAWHLMLLSIAWRYVGQHDRALYWGLEARALLSAVAGPEHSAWPKVSDQIGRAIHPSARSGACEEALPYFEEALAGYLRHGNPEEASLVQIELATCLQQLGQLEAALEQARAATVHWRDHQPEFLSSVQSAHLLVAALLAELGRIAEARAEYEHVLTIVDLESSTTLRDEARRALERLPQVERARRRIGVP